MFGQQSLNFLAAICTPGILRDCWNAMGRVVIVRLIGKIYDVVPAK
jgi:hypothetical protein